MGPHGLVEVPSGCEVRERGLEPPSSFTRETRRYDSRTLRDPMPSTLNHEEAYGESFGSLHGDRTSGQSASAPRGSMIRRWDPPCRAAGSPRHRCMRDVVDEVEQVGFGRSGLSHWATQPRGTDTVPYLPKYTCSVHAITVHGLRLATDCEITTIEIARP